MVAWLHSMPLELGRTYLVKHTVRQTKIRALRIRNRVNVNTLATEPAAHLEINEIGSVEFETHVPLFFDPYSSNRVTGSFILIDALTNATVGAGMIQEDSSATRIDEAQGREFASYAVAENPVTEEERYARHGHSPAIFLLEDRPALAARLERLLFALGFEVLHFQGREFSDDSLIGALRLTQSAGIIVLYSGNSLAASTKHRLAAEFDNHFFDLDATQELGGSDEQVAKRVLAFSRSLWLAGPGKDQEGMN
jgi:bifunctional enzyme CysN/CysC/sulfate adenylyltransferase subunit 1